MTDAEKLIEHFASSIAALKVELVRSRAVNSRANHGSCFIAPESPGDIGAVIARNQQAWEKGREGKN